MAALTPRPSETTYDPGIRRRSLRRGRERGCHIYIPASVLHDAGFVGESPPFYRLVGHRRSRNAGSVIVSLYREP